MDQNWSGTKAELLRKVAVVKLLANVIKIASGETKPAIYLRYRRREQDGFESFLTLYTNVTTFKIPIVIFNGKLKITLYSLNKNEFNFGLMGPGDSRSVQVIFQISFFLFSFRLEKSCFFFSISHNLYDS
ncbi:unnamed protein product [Gongylonema pulchrum]|uniref:Glutaredoxin domain-containing protein n=1 Tax=Gongylonema pulchrum TaxID=637853 RepID=A0A183EW27_9BILA|nr:unnamed protein product [Gongylonema pulchrum]